MRARNAIGIVLATAGAWACAGSVQPAGPSSPQAAAAVQAAPPVQPTAPASTANAAPTISGPDKCISPLGEDHVFDLEFRDQDGDAISWTAVKRYATGWLHEVGGGPFASGTTVRLVYSPPRGQGDENWITVTAIDDRGASAEMKLFVKNH